MEKENYLFKVISQMQDEIKDLKETIKKISSENETKIEGDIEDRMCQIEAVLKVHTNHIANLEKRTKKWTDSFRFGKYKRKDINSEVEIGRANAKKRVVFNFNED